MANVPPETPKSSCDNCGKVAAREKRPFKEEWGQPEKWGGCSVSTTVQGHYPNHIKMGDLCCECLKAVHSAVSSALKEARGGV